MFGKLKSFGRDGDWCRHSAPFSVRFLLVLPRRNQRHFSAGALPCVVRWLKFQLGHPSVLHFRPLSSVRPLCEVRQLPSPHVLCSSCSHASQTPYGLFDESSECSWSIHQWHKQWQWRVCQSSADRIFKQKLAPCFWRIAEIISYVFYLNQYSYQFHLLKLKNVINVYRSFDPKLDENVNPTFWYQNTVWLIDIIGIVNFAF